MIYPSREMDVSAEKQVLRLNRVALRTLALVCGISFSIGAVAQDNQCPLESAVKYRAEAWVIGKKIGSGKIDQAAGSAALSVAFENMPDSCQMEMTEAGLTPDEECQQINLRALIRNETAMNTANSYYDGTENEAGFRVKARAVIKNMLSSTPQRCWFQEAAQPPPPPGRSAQCQQLWNQYWSCKREADEDAKRCAVRPSGSCNIRYCLYPPNIGCY